MEGYVDSSIENRIDRKRTVCRGKGLTDATAPTKSPGWLFSVKKVVVDPLALFAKAKVAAKNTAAVKMVRGFLTSFPTFSP